MEMELGVHEGDGKEACIPIVDLSELQSAGGRTRVVRQIAQSLSDSPAFYVVNHGIPLHLLRKFMDAGETFLKLPVEEQTKYRVGTFSGDHEVYPQGFEGDFRISFRALYHPQAQAHRHLWPQSYKDEEGAIAEMNTAALSLSFKLLSLLAEVVDLDFSVLESAIGEPAAGFLQAYYKPKDTDQCRTEGSGGDHLDVGLIYLIMEHSDRVTGLQVNMLGPDSEEPCWQTTRRPHPEALLVLISEQLEVLTNGALRAAHHRVVTPMEDRFSSILMLFPQMDIPISPLPKMVEAMGQALPYKPMTLLERRAMMIKFGFKRKHIFHVA